MTSTDVETAALMEKETTMSEAEKLELEKEAEVEVVNQMTRRKAIIIIIVLAIVLAIVFIIAASVIASQINNVVGSGPSPPISTYITSTDIIGCNSTTESGGCYGIPQGGMLISRPAFRYIMHFDTTLTLNISGTTAGGIVWQSDKVTGLVPGSQALLQLTNQGVLIVWIPDETSTGKIITVSENQPGEIGNYILQVTEFQAENQSNPWGGQLQITGPDGEIVWSVGIPYPDPA